MLLNKFILFVGFITFFFASVDSVFAQVEFSGYGSSGYKWYNRDPLEDEPQQFYYRGKLQADFEVSKEIEGQLDFRGYSDDQHVEFREFTIKFEYLSRFTVKVGNQKQPFGLEQLVSRDDYILIERSMLHDWMEDFGYAQRALSIMGYSEYDSDEHDLPLSYYISVFGNNSLQRGLSARLSHHIGDLSYSGSYVYLFSGGEFHLHTHAVSGDISLDLKDFDSSIEVFLAENTHENLRKKTLDIHQNVYALGAKFLVGAEFNTKWGIIEEIEPVILFDYFNPDTRISSEYMLQFVPGFNMYFHKNIRFRVNGSLLLTKYRYNTAFSNRNSTFTIELQAKF